MKTTVKQITQDKRTVLFNSEYKPRVFLHCLSSFFFPTFFSFSPFQVPWCVIERTGHFPDQSTQYNQTFRATNETIYNTKTLPTNFQTFFSKRFLRLPTLGSFVTLGLVTQPVCTFRKRPLLSDRVKDKHFGSVYSLCLYNTIFIEKKLMIAPLLSVTLK